jgi:GTPase SAR1 family protein
MTEINKNAPEGTKVVLVGNKCDLIQQRIVDSAEARTFAEKNNLKYVETSAKDGSGVQDAFRSLTEDILTVVG